MNSLTTLKNGGMKNTTHPQPNFAKKSVGSHNPKTIHVCTAKKVIIIAPATPKDILAFSDIPLNAFILKICFLKTAFREKPFTRAESCPYTDV